VTFYVDASVPVAVRRALAEVRDDVRYAGEPGCPAEDTPDDQWLATAGQNDWIVIKRDKKIRSRPGERKALVDAEVRTFCLTSGGNYNRWEVLELLATRWKRIEEVATTTEGPYVYSVTREGVKALALPTETPAPLS
jgi:hypothetical protein